MRYFLFFCLCFTGIQVLNAQKINKLIREKQVRAILQTLSSDEMAGRKPGAAGIEQAASYISKQFQQAGIRPLDGEKGFLQAFEVFQGEVLTQDIRADEASVPQENTLALASTSQIKMDPSTTELVYIGPGQNFGQTLFGLSQGGKDLFVVADTSHQRSFTRFRNFKLQRMKGSGNIVAILLPARPAAFSVEATCKITATGYANVAGMIPGKTRPEEIVLFSAHYDHLGTGKAVNGDSIFNGANDDASGTTAVISLARYFSKLKNNDRTLVFAAFTAEESGGFGSGYFSSRLSPEKVIAMFNIEMIGTQSKWGPNSAYITGYEKSSFGAILQETLAGTGFIFYADPYPKENLFYRSDNATLASLGVPAHTISTSKMDSEKYYHTVDDEIGTLDLQNMTEIIKAIALSSKKIISGEKTPGRVVEEK